MASNVCQRNELNFQKKMKCWECESTHFASICPGLFQASLRAVPTPQDFWAQDAHLGAEVGGFNILEAIRLGLQWPWTAGSSSGVCLVQEVQKGFCEAAVSLVVSGRDYYFQFLVWVISHLQHIYIYKYVYKYVYK